MNSAAGDYAKSGAACERNSAGFAVARRRCAGARFGAFWRPDYRGSAMSMSVLARRAACVLVFVFTGLRAAIAAAPTASEQQAVDTLRRAVDAVVGVQVTAAEGARSAETLGRRRAGSGVVIGPDGLILTIGYLILEADSIQVITQD